MPTDIKLSVTPKLPIIADPDIENGYVKLDNADILYVNFETTSLVSLSGSVTADTVCALTASLTNSFSGRYQAIRMALFNNGFENTFTGLTSDIGVYEIRKRNFDTSIKPGTLTATVSGGLFAGDFIDTGSGQMKRVSNAAIVGNILYDDGILVITSSASSITNSISSVRYNAKVLNTQLNVFCKCQSDELNFTLNPTAFASDDVDNWLSEPFTASTSASRYNSQLTLSGVGWSPYITHVGVYDDNNELLAVAKLAIPLKKPTDLPMTFRLNIDI